MDKIKVKEKQVEQLAEIIDSSRGVLVAEYEGLSVSDLTELRSRLRDNGSIARVYKNGISRRAFKKLDRAHPEELLKGPNIIFYSTTDVVSMSKQVVDFSNENEKLTIKGGFLSEDFIDVKTVNQLAKLPSRDELIAKTVGLIKGPVTGLVMTLASPVSGLINVLNNIKSKKQ